MNAELESTAEEEKKEDKTKILNYEKEYNLTIEKIEEIKKESLLQKKIIQKGSGFRALVRKPIGVRAEREQGRLRFLVEDRSFIDAESPFSGAARLSVISIGSKLKLHGIEVRGEPPPGSGR